MSYTERQVSEALRLVRIKFFRSAGITAVAGMAGLYFISQGSESKDISISAMLFCGFIVGFFVAGIVLPQGFVAQLRKERDKDAKP